jgi:hypothetical protein
MNSGGAKRERSKKAGHRLPHCTNKSPLPLLPSGPGGVGGNVSRKTDTRRFDCNKEFHTMMSSRIMPAGDER